LRLPRRSKVSGKRRNIFEEKVHGSFRTVQGRGPW
jgi:hypothetical protein